MSERWAFYPVLAVTRECTPGWYSLSIHDGVWWLVESPAYVPQVGDKAGIYGHHPQGWGSRIIHLTLGERWIF